MVRNGLTRRSKAGAPLQASPKASACSGGSQPSSSEASQGGRERPKPSPEYLSGYPPALVEQIRQLIEQDQLADRLLSKYPQAHEVGTDRAL